MQSTQLCIISSNEQSKQEEVSQTIDAITYEQKQKSADSHILPAKVSI